MQVTIIELSQFHQPRFIENDHACAVEIKNAVAAQWLDDTIGMNAGDAENQNVGS